MEIQEKVDRFNYLQKKSNLMDEEEQELDYLAEEFLAITKQAYDNICIDYSYADRTSVIDRMIEIYNILFQTAEKVLDKPICDMTVLDVGTGTGKDIKYMNSRGITKVIGLDNSEGMIKVLKELEKRKEIPKNSFIKGDMLNLPFDNNSFDIVRQNASLLHIPITTKGKMLDKVMQENNRVLRKNGILFVSVKKGHGVQFIDTKEGFDKRIFQMHTIESITKVMEKNDFEILRMIEIKEERQGTNIDWINIIAKKV